MASSSNILGAGITFPGSSTWNTDLSSLTSALGEAPAFVNTFIDFSDGWGSAAMQNQAYWSASILSGLGYTPVVAVPMAMTSDASADAAFQAIASGAHDAAFETIFQDYANAGFKTFEIRPGWEFNGTWAGMFPWAVNSSNVGDYVAAFDHIAALAHSFSGATIKVIWEPGGGSPYSSAMYPGNQAVDIVGIDQYGDGASGTANNQVFESDGAYWSFTEAAQMAVANGKPFSADEVTDTPSDTPQFASDVAQALASVPGLAVDHITLFDDPSGQFWSNDTNASAAWRQAFAAISGASGGAAAAAAPITTSAPSTTSNTAPTTPPSSATSSNASTNYITPGSGSFTDAAGNVYTVSSTGNADENGAQIPDGSGTAAMEYYNGTVYGQDAASGRWYTWNQATWTPTSNAPSAAVSAATVSIGANQSSTTVNQSSETISATSGNHTVFLYGSNDTIQMSGGTETIQDNGSNNTFVLPQAGSGYDVLSGSELTNGDTFDFRTALAATNWDGNSGDLSNYLQVTSGGNTTVSISTTAGGSATQVLVLNGVEESMSQILAHSVT